MERPLAYRILRFGLKVASRAATDIVDRAMQRNGVVDAQPAVVEAAARRFRRTTSRGPVQIAFDGVAEGEVEHGTTILEAAKLLDVDLDHYCGGNCSCGTCRVVVLAGREHLSRQQSMEQMALGHSGVVAGDRLACQTRILGPVRVQVPDWF